MYMAVQRYEFYFRVVKTIFYERVWQLSKILFLTPENKTSYLQATVLFSFYYIDKLTVCTNNCEKAGNDVISMLNSNDMENTPLRSQM